MTGKLIAALSVASLVTACAPSGGPVVVYDVTLPPIPPGSHVTMRRAPMIDYQGLSARVSGLDIPIKQIGGDIKVGAASFDPVSLRDASDMIKVLDIAQFNSCRSIPFVAENDRYKAVQDSNTQMLSVMQLLVNLNTAQNTSDA